MVGNNFEIEILDRLIETKRFFDYAHGLHGWQMTTKVNENCLDTVIIDPHGQIQFEAAITPINETNVNLIDYHIRRTYIFPHLNSEI